MAWWDHEDLKSPENKSARYKLTFPKGYSKKQLEEAAKEYEEEKRYIASIQK